MSRALRLACFAALSSVLATAAQAQAVYTWKDAQGVTHYADAPPPKAARQAVKTVRTVPAPRAGVAVAATAAATAAPTASAAATTTAAQAAREAAATNARCSQARANLAALQGTAPVGPDTNGDGKPDSTLGADERATQVAAMQAAIQRDCTGG